jgi:hypothetical protein
MISRDITFDDFKATIYTTFGCMDVKVKPQLTYRIGTRGHIYSLTDDNDFSSLMNSKELTSKKCAEVKVFILIPKKVCFIYPSIYHTSA